jgi:phosphoglycerate kinase
MPEFRTLDDIEVKGRRVLVRVDLNVPMKDGKVTDATRIARVAPTLAELASKGAKVVVLSHFGRPDGKRVDSMSLSPLVEPLSQALAGKSIGFAEDCIGASAKAAVDALAPGDVALLENTRFHAGEEANDPDFTKALAANGDLYVNDAFSAAHRAHASTTGLAKLLPAAAGRNMQAELEALGQALETPRRPVAAIVGGAKVSSKLELLGNLVGRVDVLAIGGGMANTFLFAQGVEVGTSLCERDMANMASKIMAKAAQASCAIVLPQDAVVADKLAPNMPTRTVPIDAVPKQQMILDIGPKSAQLLADHRAKCHTRVWNGPVGAFEIAPFDAGTTAIARAVADLTKAGMLTSVAGGGDTVAALAHAGVEGALSYVSTAGGAFLEWLEGKDLPGVAALKQ